MRKFFICILLIALVVAYGCSSTGSTVVMPTNESPEQMAGRSNETISTDSIPGQTTRGDSPNGSTVVGHPQKPLPVYTPELIVQAPAEVIEGDFEFTPTMRRLYYNIPGPFIALAPEGVIDEIFEKDKDIYTEKQEMALVKLVKRCNISKQDFEKAVEAYIEMCVSAGFNMAEEDFEIPNADIIYTFDNDVINDYYRRR